MRVAFLKSDIGKRGGLEKYALRLAGAFAKKGHKVSYLTTDFDPKLLPDLPFDVVNLGKRFPVSSWHLLTFDSKCTKYLEGTPHDIVFGLDRNFCLQTHYRAGNGVHAAYLERRKKRESWMRSFSFSINPLHQLILAMEKKTFESRRLMTLFTNSYMVKEEVLSFYNVPPEKIEVVHNGVEWYELQKPFVEGWERQDELRVERGLSSDCFQFLFVGNDYERKGLGLLLEALSQIKNESFQLSVIGKERNHARFVAMRDALGLEKCVHFFGQRDDIKAFYSIADALVIPSFYDPFANVTVEALAMGVPVVSSTSNGGSEILTRDILGSTFSDLDSPDDLVDHLKKALKWPKTRSQADEIRSCIEPLDFSNQLEKIVQHTSNSRS